jgi:hypothetical protein
MCARATDLIGELTGAVANSLTRSQLLTGARPHPTFSEGIAEALEARPKDVPFTVLPPEDSAGGAPRGRFTPFRRLHILDGTLFFPALPADDPLSFFLCSSRAPLLRGPARRKKPGPTVKTGEKSPLRF